MHLHIRAYRSVQQRCACDKIYTVNIHEAKTLFRYIMTAIGRTDDEESLFCKKS